MKLSEAIDLAVAALKVQGRKLAPEANLYQKGARAPSLENAWLKHTKIRAAVAVLEPLGERSGPSCTE